MDLHWRVLRLKSRALFLIARKRMVRPYRRHSASTPSKRTGAALPRSSSMCSVPCVEGSVAALAA